MKDYIFKILDVLPQGLYVAENDKVKFLTEGRWIRCSVCGRYVQNDEFFGPDEDQSKFTRTNCFKCYNLRTREFNELESRTMAMFKGDARRSLEKVAAKENLLLDSISVGDLVEMLSKYPKDMKIMSPMLYDSEYGDSEPQPISLKLEDFVNGKQIVRIEG